MNANCTADEAARCLRLLRSKGPLPAADIANCLGIGGKRETQRRHIRAIIRHLRECGEMIVATLKDGYFVTDDVKIWRDYLEGRQIDAKRVLGKTHRQLRMVTDGNGQGLLFVPGSSAFVNASFAKS